MGLGEELCSRVRWGAVAARSVVRALDFGWVKGVGCGGCVQGYEVGQIEYFSTVILVLLFQRSPAKQEQPQYSFAAPPLLPPPPHTK